MVGIFIGTTVSSDNLDNPRTFTPCAAQLCTLCSMSTSCQSPWCQYKNRVGKTYPGHRAGKSAEMSGSQAQVEGSLGGKFLSSVGRWWKSLLSTKTPKDKACRTWAEAVMCQREKVVTGNRVLPLHERAGMLWA